MPGRPLILQIQDKNIKHTITGIFPEAVNIHLTKDVGEIAYCMHKKYGFNAVLAVKKNDHSYGYLENEVKGLRLDMMDKGVFSYLLKNSKKIDILYLFHYKRINFIYFFLYKLLNPRGIAYLKLDCDIANFDGFFKKTGRNVVKFVLASGLINFAAFITDIFSTEVKEGIDKISSFHPQIGKKLVYIPNGIDAGLAGKIFAEVKKADKKENIIITAGRIGTKQKNSLMLLKALELLDLRDWKVFFVGSVEDDFCGTIADFFEKNPYLRDRVIFKGMLEKKEELYSIYNRAKVFVLTSEFEGFPLVFPEALHFGNLIVTTRIGPADDITDSGRIGFVIGQNDHEALAKKLFEIIKDPGIYASKYDSIIEYSKNFTWDNIASMLYNAVKNTGRSFTDPG